MEITLKHFHDLNVIAIEGSIDHANSGSFTEYMESHIDSCRVNTPPLVLDMSNVNYISSAGMRVLMVAVRRIESQGGKFGVASIQPVIQEIFAISKFHLVLPCYKDLEAARQSML